MTCQNECKTSGLRVAIVHDWLPTVGGAEKVLKEILSIFPQADVFTLIDLLSRDEKDQIGLQVDPTTSILNRWRWVRKRYRFLLPIMPIVIEQFNLEKYDIIISNSYAVAKGVVVHPHQYHVCYCCSPIRYAWDMKYQYVQQTGGGNRVKIFMMKVVLHYLRIWDVASSTSVDRYITLSKFVADRINKCYRRDSTVVYPPVDVDRFRPNGKKQNYFITVSRLIGYKRIDLIIKSFLERSDLQLKVIGDGPEMDRYRELVCDTDNIELLGFVDQEKTIEYVAGARAFVFASKEDFGIAPVEAQAAGVPVIAYSGGGAGETVIDGVTGVHFSEQSVASVMAALDRFCSIEEKLVPDEIRKNALRFSSSIFVQRFQDEVMGGYHKWIKRHEVNGC